MSASEAALPSSSGNPAVPALRLLMITPTDYIEMWNNVEHGRVRTYSAQGVPITVVHLKLNRRGGMWNMLKDAFSFRVRPYEKDGVEFVAVDPFFNYTAGLRVQSDTRVKAGGGRITLRHLVVRALAPLAVMRDVFFTPCFIVAGLRKTQGKFDAVLGIGPWGSLVGLALRGMGKARILVYEDRDFDPGLLPDRLRQWYTGIVERFVQRRADIVISVGQRLAALRRKSGVNPAVISNGIDWDNFAEARLNSGKSPTILYVGNITSWSGLEESIRAMALLRQSLPQARLLVVGSGLPDYERHLKDVVEQLSLSDIVEFAGSQPHSSLPTWMGRASVGLANSQPVAYRQYACPLKVIEYMAGGLPCLTTQGTEAADMVARYQCGVAAAFEIPAMAQELCRLLTDRVSYDRLRQEGVRQSYNLDWKRLLAVEQQMIEEKLRIRRRP